MLFGNISAKFMITLTIYSIWTADFSYLHFLEIPVSPSPDLSATHCISASAIFECKCFRKELSAPIALYDDIVMILYLEERGHWRMVSFVCSRVFHLRSC